MTDDDDELPDALVPPEVLEPVLDWMKTHDIAELRVRAAEIPPAAETEPARDETQNLLYCDEQPDAPALLNIYETTDEQGDVRLNGPSPVPQAVLRPLLKALAAAAVAELLIATQSGSEQSLFPTVTTTTCEMVDEFVEHAVPPADNWPPALIAVQVS